MLTQTEENYLKAIFKLEEIGGGNPVSTNDIAALMQTKAASVTDMVKRLADKKLLSYEKYRGVQLTKMGSSVATALVRKHRLWEVFLVDKLNFAWDEVHIIAEQLEHIQSDILTSKLNNFLGNPKFDPHGDPIPDASGRINYQSQVTLANLSPNEKCMVVGVIDSSSEFLQYLDRLGIGLGVKLEVINHFSYDNSREIIVKGKEKFIISEQVASNLIITK